MKKQKKILLLLSAALLLLIILLLVVLLGPKKPGSGETGTPSDNQDGQVTLIETDPSQISSVTVTNTFGTYTITLKDGQAELEHYAQVPLDAAALDSLFHYSSVLRSRQSLPNAEDLSQYSLDAPEAAVHVLLTDGKEYDAAFGAQVPGQDTAPVRYMLYDGTVYTTFQLYCAPFFLSEDQYIDHQITPVSRNASDAKATAENMLTITRASIYDEAGQSGLSGVILLAGADDVMGYTLQQYTLELGDHTYPYTTDSIGVEYLASFLNLTADEIAAVHPNADTLAACYLDAPAMKAEVSWKNAAGLEGSFELLLSDPNEHGVYIMRPDLDLVYRVAQVPLFCRTEFDRLISTYLLMPALSDLSGVTIDTGDTQYHFTINAEASQVMLGEENMPFKAFQDFYEKLIRMKAEKVLLDPPDPAGLPPAGKITYERKDGAVQEILLYTLSARKLLALVNETAYELSAAAWSEIGEYSIQ